MKVGLIAISAVALVGCSTPEKVAYKEPIAARKIASCDRDECALFDQFAAKDKLNQFIDDQRAALEKVRYTDAESKLSKNRYKRFKHLTTEQVDQALQGNNEVTFNYIKSFMAQQKVAGKEFYYATLATTKFLIPGKSSYFGHQTLRPTFENNCEVIKGPETKKVHALGSLATAEFKAYDYIAKIGADGEVTSEEMKNPFSGLLGAQDKAVPMLLRFSIATPLSAT